MVLSILASSKIEDKSDYKRGSMSASYNFGIEPVKKSDQVKGMIILNKRVGSSYQSALVH